MMEGVSLKALAAEIKRLEKHLGFHFKNEYTLISFICKGNQNNVQGKK